MGDHLATIDMGCRLYGRRQCPCCCAPFRGGAGSPSNTVWPGMRPTGMPSSILIHSILWPQYTNVTDSTGQTHRQWSDRIARTVLQTIAQKLNLGLVTSYDIQPGNGKGLCWFQFLQKVLFWNRWKRATGATGYPSS